MQSPERPRFVTALVPPAQAQIREHNNFFDRLFGSFGHSNKWRNKSYTGKQVVD